MEEYELEGPSPPALVDELSARIKETLEAPGGGRALVTDLPVADRLSASAEAMRLFVEARNAIVFGNDHDRAIELWESAVELDPSFAAANLLLSQAYFERGRLEDARLAIDRVLAHDYKLLEREKFVARGVDYLMRGEGAKRTALFQMWAELYPEDTLAHTYLGLTRLYTDNDPAGAKQSFERILQLDPKEHWALRMLARIYQIEGDPERALEYYERYFKARPDDHRPLMSMGRLHRRAGRLAEARRYFERASLVSTGEVEPLLSLADLDIREGDFEAAERGLREAEAMARLPRQRAEVIRIRMDWHEQRGQLDTVVDLLQEAYEVQGEFRSPINRIVNTHVILADRYALAGRAEEGMRKLKQMEALLEPPVDELVQIGYMLVELVSGHPDEAEQHAERVRVLLEHFAREDLLYKVTRCEAHIQALRGDYQGAVEMMVAALEQHAASVQSIESEEDRVPMLVWLASFHRRAGQLREADERLQQALAVFPAHPLANLEQARLARARGDASDARDSLQRALAVWEAAAAADPPFLEARALEAEFDGEQQSTR